MRFIIATSSKRLVVANCSVAAARMRRSNWSGRCFPLWAMGLYASVELHTQEIPLERLSFASVLSAFREMARDYLHVVNPGRTLRILLRQSLIDTYTRTRPKGNREYPCKKKRKPPGPPNIQEATKQQRDHAKRLKKKKTLNGVGWHPPGMFGLSM